MALNYFLFPDGIEGMTPHKLARRAKVPIKECIWGKELLDFLGEDAKKLKFIHAKEYFPELYKEDK